MGKKNAPQTLNDREIAFCLEYVKSYNAAEAYRTTVKDKSKDATWMRKAGWRMLQRPEVQEYIKELKNNLAELSMLSRFKVLDEYSKIAFASMDQFQEDWLKTKKFKDLTPEQKAVIAEIRVTYNDTGAPTISFRLHDKIRALDSIARMLGYDAPTKLQLEGLIPAPPQINVYKGQLPPLASSEDAVDDK